MEILQEHDSKIREIMSGIQCNRDFKCYKSGFEDLCKAGIVGNARLIECLEEKAETCEYVFSFGHGNICICQLRHYIAKHFNR